MVATPSSLCRHKRCFVSRLFSRAECTVKYRAASRLGQRWHLYFTYYVIVKSPSSLNKHQEQRLHKLLTQVKAEQGSSTECTSLCTRSVAGSVREPAVLRGSSAGISVLTGAGRLGWETARALNRSVVPLSLLVDAARLAVSAWQDRGVGRHVACTGASIAGSWAGAAAGAAAGSHVGAVLGLWAGPVGLAMGSVVGGVAGAVCGALGLASLSERGVGKLVGKASGSSPAPPPEKEVLRRKRGSWWLRRCRLHKHARCPTGALSA